MDCSVVGWCTLPLEAQAAWVQAIFSIVGIGVAIAVPATQHYLDRRMQRVNDELRARSIAMSLLPYFQQVGKQLNNVWAYEHQDEFEEIDHPPVGPHTASALAIPPRLEALSDRLHELGRAAGSAQRCVYHIARARESVTTGENSQVVIFQKADFYDHLWEATVACSATLNLIDDMFEAEVGEEAH